MRKFWAYILIGANETGKSTIQKHIAFNIAAHPLYKKLRMNSQFPIRHAAFPAHYEKIFFMNHSIQERMSTYGTVDNFFDKVQFFKAVDIGILSSHEEPACWPDVERMIYRLRRECYNVSGIFFSNCWNANSQHIATFAWDEIFWVNNEVISMPDKPSEEKYHIDMRLKQEASNISAFLVERAKSHSTYRLI